MNVDGQVRNFRCLGRIVAEIGRYDTGGEFNWRLAGGIGHGSTFPRIADGPRDSDSIRPVYTLRNLARLDEYERIAGNLTRTTVFYFQNGFCCKYCPLRGADRGASAIRRSRQSASCLPAFAPRSNRRNRANRPSLRQRLTSGP